MFEKLISKFERFSGLNKPKILVTGASGYIGGEVARQLSEGGYRPRLFIYEPQKHLANKAFDADYVFGDLEDPQSLKPAVKDVDCIIHLAARATFESYQTLKPSILDGSTTLMELAADAGVKAFVYSSSILVYGDVASTVDAETSTNPVLDYGRIKIDTEKRLAEMAAAAGMTFCALRLPHVYGSQAIYFRQLNSGLLVLPGGGNNIYSHQHLFDTARILIACAEQEYSGITPMGDDEPTTWRTFTALVKTLVPGARILVVPQWVGLLMAAVLIPLQRFRPLPGIETAGAVRTFNCRTAVKPGLVRKDLGISLRYPTFRAGVPEVVAELNAMPQAA